MALAVINAVLAISIVRTFFQCAFFIIKNANPVMLLFAPKIFTWYHSLSSFLSIKLNDISFTSLLPYILVLLIECKTKFKIKKERFHAPFPICLSIILLSISHSMYRCYTFPGSNHRRSNPA